MKTKYRVATMSALVFLLGAGALRCTPDVGATPTGQIVGTVKLDGPAPHPRTIDMSKDPGCIQVGKGSSPAVAEEWLWERTAGWPMSSCIFRRD